MPGCSVMAVLSVSSKGGLVLILAIKSVVGCLKNMIVTPWYLARSRSLLLAVQKLWCVRKSSKRVLREYLCVQKPPP